jgi:hypothetical protein
MAESDPQLIGVVAVTLFLAKQMAGYCASTGISLPQDVGHKLTHGAKIFPSNWIACPEILQYLRSITATYCVKIICNEKIGQEKRLCCGFFLTLYLLFLDGAFMRLPIASSSTDNQMGAFLADFRFVESGHFDISNLLCGYNEKISIITGNYKC